jgi:energy-coupling factor transporter ATP-binding protein EcfA2
MALGPNEIKLDIPGLTRIVGNNGIGKTTLFNLLRWIIKGYVLEGLPKNTKKENLLLIFNVELPEKDFIINTLYLKVNDITVEIERNAKRTWKKSATLENKKSLNWKTFIDTVTSNLTLRIYPKLKYVVISRDPHYNCIMSYYDISIFNGRDLVDRGSLKYLKDLPDINYTMLPFYYLIRGMDRNEYKGVKLYGQKKTEKYINENLTTLITWEDPILEEVKPYKNIFFLNDLKIDS